MPNRDDVEEEPFARPVDQLAANETCDQTEHYHAMIDMVCPPGFGTDVVALDDLVRRPSSDCGIVSPSALAVFMLIASSNFSGRCTGRSQAFAPLRIRST
jgi:hypothetical protein